MFQLKKTIGDVCSCLKSCKWYTKKHHRVGFCVPSHRICACASGKCHWWKHHGQSDSTACRVWRNKHGPNDSSRHRNCVFGQNQPMGNGWFREARPSAWTHSNWWVRFVKEVPRLAEWQQMFAVSRLPKSARLLETRWIVFRVPRSTQQHLVGRLTPLAYLAVPVEAWRGCFSHRRLTAYVAKVFTMASSLVSVRSSTICDAIKFLIFKRQQPDGQFRETGSVNNRDMTVHPLIHLGVIDKCCFASTK